MDELKKYENFSIELKTNDLDALKELSEDTQFIAVTHRRGTMEAADYIYGVTMEKKAISKVISLNLKEAHKMADIV